jgi:hypothetical protein
MISKTVIKESAQAVAEFIDQLEEQGIGPELTQKLAVAVAPTLIQGVLYPYTGEGYAVA